MWPFIRDMLAESMEGDRMRLAFAQAGYQAEIVRLGHVVTTLTERPVGMEDSYLQKAVQKTVDSYSGSEVLVNLVSNKPRECTSSIIPLS